MAKGRAKWFIGIGCAVVFLAVCLGALVVLVGLAGPGLPGKAVLDIKLSGPIVEIKADDPLEELMGVPSTSLRELRAALVRAAEDNRIKGLRMRVDSFDGGFATAQELRALIARFNASGKWSAAYMDTAGEFAPGNLSYFVASACQEVSLNPLGDVNLIGLSARVPFYRGTFDKLGIKPEFPGRGEFKSARFSYTQTRFTPAHQEMMEWLIDSLMEQLVSGIAASRGLEPEQVLHLVDQAPFLGDEAVTANLVDHIEDWGGFMTRLQDKEPGADPVGFARYAKSTKRSGGDKIAVITGVGTILRGQSRQDVNPLLGGQVMGSDTLAKAWRDARSIRGLKAVIFRVDSPGGSAVASEVIRQEMVRTAEEVPVVVSMSNVAASGGYWISCGAQRIVADPGTLTASIGVYAGHFNMDELFADKLGITYGRLDRGANAGMYGVLDDWDQGERAEIEGMLDRIYDAFLERAAASRQMSTEEIDAIGRGRVFTGNQAEANGLVDLVGGFDEALEEAQKLAGIAPGAPVRLIDLPRPKPWWQEILEAGQEERVALRNAAETLNEWFETGTARAPGALWMPPIWIR